MAKLYELNQDNQINALYKTSVIKNKDIQIIKLKIYKIWEKVKHKL